MSETHVCPWWLGPVLANPLRRLLHNPEKILSPYIKDGMSVLEMGPGMGFWTLPMACMVGPSGKIVAVDIQPKMLEGLKKRALKAGLLDQIDIRLATDKSSGVSGSFDIVILFAVAHEIPDIGRLFKNIHSVLKNDGLVLMADPSGHCTQQQFDKMLGVAWDVGFTSGPGPRVWRSWTAVLKKRVS